MIKNPFFFRRCDYFYIGYVEQYSLWYSYNYKLHNIVSATLYINRRMNLKHFPGTYIKRMKGRKKNVNRVVAQLHLDMSIGWFYLTPNCDCKEELTPNSSRYQNSGFFDLILKLQQTLTPTYSNNSVLPS